MKAKGYDNKFIYAGYGFFDNMNAFFRRQWFFHQWIAPTLPRKRSAFANIWGVCDEDLFRG